MEEQELQVISPSEALAASQNEITNDIIKEQDPSKVKDLTALFEMNQRKKNIARINKLSNLLDTVDNEVINRMKVEPENFDNELLLKYMESTQKTINSIENNMNQTPLVQINNQKNEININNSSGLDRESRKKVLDTVMAILNNAKEEKVIDTEFTEEE